MPELSIVVTTYNIENYIEQCLESLISQTLTDIEIIVVDDGSTDRTPELIGAFSQKDERIKAVFLQANSIGGVATPANTGLDMATAPYVGFADGDDYCEPHMFEALLEAARDGHHDLAMCRYKLVDESTGALSDPAEAGRWVDVTDRYYQLTTENKKRFLKFIAVPWRKIYKRGLLEDNAIRFPVGDYYYEDNPFHWFVITSASSIAIVPEVLCFHRVDRAGQTMATADERLFRVFQHHDTIREWMVGRGLEPTYRSTIFAWAISQMEWISRRTPKPLRRKLFDILRGVYDQYDSKDMEAALTEGQKGQTARRLSDALAKNNFAKFNQYLDGSPKKNSILTDGLYHLRYSGLRHTTGLVRRYAIEKAKNQFGRSGKISALTSRHFKPTDVRNEDLMLALVVLQKQIKRLEARLDASLNKKNSK